MHQSGYKFISPLLECVTENPLPILKSDELKIKKTIEENVIKTNPDIRISLYYRDLQNGPWFGINEQDNFSPASLLKVPLMMAYYKSTENNPAILEKEITLTSPTLKFQQNIAPIENAQVGKSYTVKELIEVMIKYSDNEAANLLFQNIDQNDLKAAFNDLGIDMPDVYNPNNSMQVKDYSAFFRILYNASYINRNMSEKALDLLSMSEYRDGLLAGVPSNIIISHKFGEREAKEENTGQTNNQLHDCGIVYHPNRPYLLCVMTKGKQFDKLSQVISKISQIVYDEVEENSK